VWELRAISEPPQTTSTSPQANTVFISAAATVPSNAEIDPNYLCFCYCDSTDMDILRLECCQNTVHRQCFIAHLMNFTQCPYCRAVVDDVVPFLECAAIERSSIVNKTPDEDVLRKNSNPPSTAPTTPAVKRNLEEMLVVAQDDNTPLCHTDVVRSESQQKRKGRQQQQVQKMMKLQGIDIASKGAAPGAVVVVQCSPTAVSHAIGIVGIIYEMSKYGGARVATIAGILSSGQKKGQWWIPSDQYIVKYGIKEEPNIPTELKVIRDAILDGTYNQVNKAPTCTIQEAHKVITNATSPCKPSRCSCSKGLCKLRKCGCIKKGSKCGSGCSCNGNCDANVNNGK